jgi:abelson tyrosine-protein kinase 1
MRAALGAGSDVEMIAVLQVGREEMPEAIKTLQRALERVGESEARGKGVSGLEIAFGRELEVVVKERKGKRGRGKKVKRSESILSKASRSSCGSGKSVAKRDTLDREFIESGIYALKWLSLTTGSVETLPSWTITRFVHFFLSYYKTLGG